MSTIGVDAQITEDNKLEIEVNGKSSQVALPYQGPSVSITKFLAGSSANIQGMMRDINNNIGHFIYFGYVYTGNEPSFFAGLINIANSLSGVGSLVNSNGTSTLYKGITFNYSLGTGFTLLAVPITPGAAITSVHQTTTNIKNFFYTIL